MYAELLVVYCTSGMPVWLFFTTTTYHLPPTIIATFCKYHRPPYHHGGSGSGGSAALKLNLASLKFSRPILHSAFIVIIIANTRFYCFNRVIVHRIDVKRSRFSSNKAFFFRNFICFFQKALGVLCLRTHIDTSEGKLSSNMRRLSANGNVWWIRVSRKAPTSNNQIFRYSPKKNLKRFLLST